MHVIDGQAGLIKGADITKEQLSTILNKYFKPIETNSIPNEVSSESEHDIELTTIDDKYKINLSQIYTGTFEAGQAKWTYNHTNQTVTNGTLTLKIGDKVNETSSHTVDGKWRVLGEENGHLLLVSTNYVDFQGSTGPEGTPLIQLQGSNGIDNEVERLNTLSAKFADGTKTEKGRIIKIEDINKITGYNLMEARMNANDLTQKTPFSNGNIGQYKNNVTYTIKSDGKVWYKGDQSETTETQSSRTKFYLPETSTNITEPFTIQSTSYTYFPETYGPFPASAVASGQTMEGLSVSSLAYDMLFKPQSNIQYCLASLCVSADIGNALWDMFVVASPGYVMVYNLWGSDLGSLNRSGGVRPAVSLKSEITPIFVSTDNSTGISTYEI